MNDYELEKRLDMIEFRQELLFNNDEISRLLFEYNITREQYTSIMSLMDNYRNAIYNSKEVSHGAFESEMYSIVPEHKGDYHMCEYLTRAFMNEGSWEEVFPALYEDMLKYKNTIHKNGWNIEILY